MLRSYGITHPNGDTLFALWTGGAAVGDAPGVTTTLTFPGVSASRVTGIDVVDRAGFEQELIVATGNGDLGRYGGQERRAQRGSGRWFAHCPGHSWCRREWENWTTRSCRT